jgi:hypothetical protein
MALGPNDCLAPEVDENETLIVELLEKAIDLWLASGLRTFDATQERKNLFNITLREKYQRAGWHLMYRPFGVSGWNIVFNACGPEDKAAETLVGRIGRPKMDMGNPVQHAGEVGDVVVDGTQREYSTIQTYPARMITQPEMPGVVGETEGESAETAEPAPRKESKRGN